MQVIGIDNTVVPPSYCVEVNGSLRETEEWRLKPSSPTCPSRQTVIAPRSDSGNLDFAKFGNFTTTLEPLGPRITVPVHPFKRRSTVDNLNAQSSADSLRARFTGSNPSSPKSPRSPEAKFRSFLAMAAPNVAHQLDDEDAHQPKSPFPVQSSSLGRNGLAFGSNICLVEQNSSPRSLFDKNFARHSHVSMSSSLDSQQSEDDFGDFIAAEWSSETQILAPTVSLDSSQFYPSEADSPTSQPGTPSGQEARLEEQIWWMNSEEPLPIPEPLTPVVPVSPVVRKLWDSYAPSPFRSHRTNGDLRDDRAVHEYGIAWEEILREAAKLLESGKKVLRHAARAAPGDAVLSQLLKMKQCQVYFAALGRIYCVATLVRHAADELGLLRLVPELRADWARCWRAWSEADTEGFLAGEASARPLCEVSLIAGLVAGINICHEIEVIEGAEALLQKLSQDDFPRMLAWSEGLEGVTLIPISALQASESSDEFGIESAAGGVGGENGSFESFLPLVEWTDGRPSLAIGANFWRGCVSPVDPELE